MAESRVFKLVDGVDCDMIGRAIEGFLREKKNMIAEGTKTPEGYFVQAKQEDSWKKVAGMSMATHVQIMQTGDMVTVNVGSGKWADKAGAAVVGMVLFAPLAITAAVGAYGQKKLPQEIFTCVEQFIMSGGRNVLVSMGASQALKVDQMLCPGCKAPNNKSAAFCVSCGTKLGAECPSCKASVPLETKFCPICGGSMAMTVENKCPVCNADVPEGKKFCPDCGASMVIELECPQCHVKVVKGKKFCPECGASMSGKRECPKCHMEVVESEKFCSECGTEI